MSLDALRLIVIGPGRAGGSLALAAARAGHEIVGIMARSDSSRFGPPIPWGAKMPAADLALIAVRDEAIPEVVATLTGSVDEVAVVAHVSGFLPTTVLGPLRARGVAIGGLHPLQTLPDPETGAAALGGSYAAVGGEEAAVGTLEALVRSLGMIPFHLEDSARAPYHAAAAASANFVVAALGLAADLFEAAGVDPEVSRPLVDQVVANVFATGSDRALTGPIARGDIETVRGHLEAAEGVSGSVGRQFREMAAATASRAGRETDIESWK